MNLASSFLVTLLQASLLASLAILVLAPGRALLRRWVPSGALYLLWTLVFVRLCYPLFGPVSVVPRPWRQGVIVAGFAANATSIALVEASQGKPAFPGLPPLEHIPRGLKTLAVIVQNGALILLTGWLAGFLVAQALALSRRRRFHKAVMASSSPADPRVVALLQAERDSSDEQKRTPVLAVTSSAVGAPACYQASRKETWIVLPPGLADQLSEGELRMVILHELAHWRRGDLKVQAVQRFIGRIHWFNPLVHWGLSLARADCESACDATVLEKLTRDEVSLYGMTLLKLAKLMKAESLPSSAVGIVEGRSRLSERIRRIASFRRPGFFATFGGFAVLGVVSIALFILSPAVLSSGSTSTPSLDQPSQQRFRDSQLLAKKGSDADALTGYEWCFDTGMKEDRGMVGVRRSFLLNAWATLGKSYPPAEEALLSRRDAARRGIEAKPGDFDSWEDFVSINQYLGEDEKTLEYYDSAKKAGTRLPDLELVFDQFLKSRRYKEAAQAQPLAKYSSDFDNFVLIERLASKIGTPKTTIDGQPPQLHYLVQISGEELEALAGAGDLVGARAVVAKILEIDHSEQTLKVLQDHAARAGHPEVVSR